MNDPLQQRARKLGAGTAFSLNDRAGMPAGSKLLDELTRDEQSDGASAIDDARGWSAEGRNEQALSQSSRQLVLSIRAAIARVR